MVCVGDPADTTPADRDVFPLTGDDVPIAELIRAVLAAEHEFAVEFAPSRVLSASTRTRGDSRRIAAYVLVELA